MMTTSVKLYQVGTFAAGNRLLDRAERTVQCRAGPRQLDHLGPPCLSGLRRGARGPVVLDAAMRATGGRLVTVNATGCLEVFSTPFPESAWQVPWLHSLFGNAAAVASGVAAALRATGRDDVRVVAQAGDGGTVDIGLGCLSGMFERNDDVLFVCYDNQGYMNTGVQRSGATPPAASTATTRPVGDRPATRSAPARACRASRWPTRSRTSPRPPSRTCTTSRPRSAQAMSMHGARYLHVLVPCPLGLGVGAPRTPSGSRGSPPRAGCSRSSRPSTARSPRATPIRRRVPVEEYLRLQPASRTCSRGPAARRGRRAAGAGRPRHRPLRAAATRGGSVMKLPFAITLGPGSSRADHTGAWRTERRSTSSGRHRAATRAPPARTCAAWLYDAESGGAGYEAAWRRDHGDQPVPRRLRPGLLPPVRDGLQPRQPRRGGRHQLRRALPRRRGAGRGLDGRVTAAPTGRRVLVVGAGPRGTLRGLPPARRGHAVTIRESAPIAGGMMRYGIPRYRLPREVLDAEIDRSLGLGVTLELDTPVTDLDADDGRRGLGRRVPGRRRPARPPHLPPGRPRPPASSTRSRCCTGSRRASAAARPPGRGVRRRQHGRRRRAHRPAAGRLRRRRRLPPHP